MGAAQSKCLTDLRIAIRNHEVGWRVGVCVSIKDSQDTRGWRLGQSPHWTQMASGPSLWSAWRTQAMARGSEVKNLLCEGSEHESGGHTGRKAGRRGPDSNSHQPLCFLPSKLSSRSWTGVGSKAWFTPGQRQEPNLPPCLCRVLAGDRGRMSESQVRG